jgi:hypothetical protein
MAATHFKGPVVSTNGFTGDITGAVTGNITGNVTGNISGGTVAGSTVTASTSVILGSVVELKATQVTITSAELLALNATPKTLIAAPGASLAILPLHIVAYKAAGTAYGGIAAGEDIAIKYTNGSGAECAPQIETTGFLDQTTAQTRFVAGNAVSVTTNITPVANAAVVAHLLSGEITTGDSDLILRITYAVLPTVLA